MAPPRSGQLDQISQAIGRLEAAFEGIDRYTHDREHAINNLMQKVDGLGIRISRDIAQSEARIGVRLDSFDVRLKAVEDFQQQQTGAKNLFVWFMQSPLIGWIVAALIFLMALWAKDGRP